MVDIDQQTPESTISTLRMKKQKQKQKKHGEIRSYKV